MVKSLYSLYSPQSLWCLCEDTNLVYFYYMLGFERKTVLGVFAYMILFLVKPE